MAEINRLVWEKGDFGAVAPMGWDVGEVVLGHVGVEQGERVLDVACGTGNAAIRAAQCGGTVTGLDIVPALLDQGRALTAEAGVEVEFVEGDAEGPPLRGHELRRRPLHVRLHVRPRPQARRVRDRPRAVPRSDGQALAAAIPDSRLVTYADTGHMVHWEDPERVAADVVALAERVRPRLGAQ